MNSRFPENWREILAKNIFSERSRLGYSQVKLLSELNEKNISIKTVGTISVWENGGGLFNVEIIDALARIFDRSPNELMYQDLRITPTEPPPTNGKYTEGVELQKHVEKELQEMDAGGVSMAAESPPIKEEKEDKIQEMRKKMLEMMLELETMKA